jgi:hypothetical protein
MSNLTNLLSIPIFDYRSQMMDMSKELKERAIRDYEKALKMPRKKKKKAKKSALLDYSMACWVDDFTY